MRLTLVIAFPRFGLDRLHVQRFGFAAVDALLNFGTEPVKLDLLELCVVVQESKSLSNHLSPRMIAASGELLGNQRLLLRV